MRKALAVVLVLQLFMLSLGGIKASLYYLINKSRIVSELCVKKTSADNDCQGRCHLKKSLKKNAEEDASQHQVFKGELLPFIPENREENELRVHALARTFAFLPWESSYNSCLQDVGLHPPCVQV